MIRRPAAWPPNRKVPPDFAPRRPRPDLQGNRSGGEGLEEWGGRATSDWITNVGPVDGVELFRAWFAGQAYAKHRHDTYAICLTDRGVQVFDYRGSARVSTPGQVSVLYPDEIHNGRAGTDDGFGYRIIYVEPAHLSDALRVLTGRACSLPFIREPVLTNARLSQALRRAFAPHTPLDSLAADGVVIDLAEGLLAAERGGQPRRSFRVDVRAVARARHFLDAERTRVVHSTELESVTGLTRYDLARQFRLLLGTSPYRYLLMRRLDFARQRIHLGRPLAEVTYEAGFADQAHFTRVFKSAFGVTPARYRALRATHGPAGQSHPHSPRLDHKDGLRDLNRLSPGECFPLAGRSAPTNNGDN